MSAHLRTLNEVALAPGKVDRVLAEWGELNQKTPVSGRTPYRGAEGVNVREVTPVTPVTDLTQLGALNAIWQKLLTSVSTSRSNPGGTRPHASKEEDTIVDVFRHGTGHDLPGLPLAARHRAGHDVRVSCPTASTP